MRLKIQTHVGNRDPYFFVLVRTFMSSRLWTSTYIWEDALLLEYEMGNTAGNTRNVVDAGAEQALTKIVSEQSYMLSDTVWATLFSIHEPLLNMLPPVLQPFLQEYSHTFGKF